MRCCSCWSWSLVCITVQQTCAEVRAVEEKRQSMWGWRGDGKDLMTLGRGQGAEACDDERSNWGINAESRWRWSDVEWRKVETMVLVWLKEVISGWNDAVGIDLSIPKIKMIGRSRSRQTLSQRSNSELFCPERRGGYLSTFAKSEKSPLRESGGEKVLRLKQSKQAQIKGNHHNNQEHDEEEEDRNGKKEFSPDCKIYHLCVWNAFAPHTSKETWLEMKEDVAVEKWRRGGV